MDKPRFRVPLRYGEMRLYGEFLAEDPGLKRGDACVVTSERGVEIGEVLRTPAPEPADSSTIFHGEILRPASDEDLARVKPFGTTRDTVEYKYCLERIDEHKLPMKLVGVEHLFGGGKIVFYFVAENRVDFRALVRDLAKEYRTRIEMKQIGVRDEAKLLGCMNNCGRTLCCRSVLKTFAPVTMKMAKNQQLPLDPARISGRCGRLKCCLRYEDEAYVSLRRQLPKKGSTIDSEHGEGRVVDREILSQRVTLALPDGKRVVIHCSSTREQDFAARSSPARAVTSESSPPRSEPPDPLGGEGPGGEASPPREPRPRDGRGPGGSGSGSRGGRSGRRRRGGRGGRNPQGGGRKPGGGDRDSGGGGGPRGGDGA